MNYLPLIEFNCIDIEDWILLNELYVYLTNLTNYLSSILHVSSILVNATVGIV